MPQDFTSPPSSLQETKARLRADMRARRSAFAASGNEKNRSFFNELSRHFQVRVEIKSGAVVAGYSAFRDEMDPAPLLDALRRQGHPIALPIVIGKGQPLAFRLVLPGDPLVRQTMGMMEPGPDCPAIDPDIVLVPLLAFDRQMHRLGYGGGFYDRTLAGLRAKKNILAIGLAYDMQRIAGVPVGINDSAMDMIVTESGVYS
jgi:5-formyltetrahydrofolate cyclo-ligase